MPKKCLLVTKLGALPAFPTLQGYRGSCDCALSTARESGRHKLHLLGKTQACPGVGELKERLPWYCCTDLTPKEKILLLSDPDKDVHSFYKV